MIKPLADRVLLEAVDNNVNVTNSGIYLPESESKERPFIYTVIAVWPGKKDIEMNVKIWDKVLAGQYSWDEVKIEDKNYKIVAMDYILAIID